MVRITISEEQKQQLIEAQGMAELQDAEGNLLGQVSPVEEKPKCAASYFADMTKEDFDRLASAPGEWLTTEQAKQRLRDLL